MTFAPEEPAQLAIAQTRRPPPARAGASAARRSGLPVAIGALMRRRGTGPFLIIALPVLRLIEPRFVKTYVK